MAKNTKAVVLVADDEPSTRALVAGHLRAKGYKVIEASDGDEAWELAHEHLPHAVVLDVMMPGMSGWEVCRKIREAVSLAHTGVVMLTGIGENLNELTSPLYGADAYVDKPFEFGDLDQKLAETLARRGGAHGTVGRPDHADQHPAGPSNGQRGSKSTPAPAPASAKSRSSAPKAKGPVKAKPEGGIVARATAKAKEVLAKLVPQSPPKKAPPKAKTKTIAPPKVEPVAAAGRAKPAAKPVAKAAATKAKPAAKRAAPKAKAKAAAKRAAPKKAKAAAKRAAPKAKAAAKRAAPKAKAAAKRAAPKAKAAAKRAAPKARAKTKAKRKATRKA